MAIQHPEYLGLWYGTTQDEPFTRYTEVVIFTPYDSYETHIQLNSRYYDIRPTACLIWTSETMFHCDLPHWALPTPITLSGTFSNSKANTTTLTIAFTGGMVAREDYTVCLHISDPDCLKYQRPAPSLSYTYRPPTVLPGDAFFPSAPASSLGLIPTDIEATVSALLKLDGGEPGDARCDGLVILKDGFCVLEEYFWGLEKDDLHDISSCTKSVTSILIGIAVDQGLCSLDDIVSDTFPEVTATEWGCGEPIRLRHLLSMSTGTAFDDSESLEFLMSPCIVKQVLGTKRIAPPGKVWNYDNSLPMLIGCFLERKIRGTIEEFADEFLFRPLGIVKEAREWMKMPKQKGKDGKELVMLSGGLRLRLRDFVKLGMLMSGGGNYNGTQILSEEYVRESTRQQTPEGQWPYGFFWHLNTDDERHLSCFDGFLALGQGEQVIAVLPEQGLVMAWMSSTWINNFGYRVAMKVIDEKFVTKIGIDAEAKFARTSCQLIP